MRVTRTIRPYSSSWVSSSASCQIVLRLFCFPYAGGGASIFGTWQNHLPREVEVCSVCLPGRERRLVEPRITRMDTLVRLISTELGPYLNQPFALFGHSMGALISFELCRLMRRECGTQPIHLFVSGYHAPQLQDPEPSYYDFPEPLFLDRLSRLNGTPKAVLEDAELTGLMLPLLRADFEAVQTYCYTPEPPLCVPITAFGGDQDSEVPPQSLEQWRDQTCLGFRTHTLPGDHFFLNTARSELLRYLAGALEQLVQQMR
jgi:medium-chain acyl-[acyl-carrier-protein] hydrolase